MFAYVHIHQHSVSKQARFVHTRCGHCACAETKFGICEAFAHAQYTDSSATAVAYVNVSAEQVFCDQYMTGPSYEEDLRQCLCRLYFVSCIGSAL
ncbi:unnamed protein product [Ixodes pacificus]